MAHLLVKVANLVSRVNNNEIEDKTLYVPQTENDNPPTLNLDGVHHTVYVNNTGLGLFGTNTHSKLIIINITPTFRTVNIFLTEDIHTDSFYIKINSGTETRYFWPSSGNPSRLIKITKNSITNLADSIFVEYINKTEDLTENIPHV